MINKIKKMFGVRQGFVKLENLNPQIEHYKPKVNQKKRVILILSFIPFALTIGTNWVWFVGVKMLNKFNPLWLYS